MPLCLIPVVYPLVINHSVDFSVLSTTIPSIIYIDPDNGVGSNGNR